MSNAGSIDLTSTSPGAAADWHNKIGNIFLKEGGEFLFHNQCCFNKKQPGLSVRPTSLSGEYNHFRSRGPRWLWGGGEGKAGERREMLGP